MISFIGYYNYSDSDVYQSVLFHCGDVVYCERVV